jgi:hypothetical protein
MWGSILPDSTPSYTDLTKGGFMDIPKCVATELETKMKLVAWATKCKGQHEQGFDWAKCCAKCGCVWPHATHNGKAAAAYAAAYILTYNTAIATAYAPDKGAIIEIAKLEAAADKAATTHAKNNYEAGTIAAAVLLALAAGDVAYAAAYTNQGED